MKKIVLAFLFALLTCFALSACSGGSSSSSDTSSANAETAEQSADGTEANASSVTLEDGVYTATFETDSSMFHVNEAYDDEGTLTVENGQMTIHVVLESEKIVNLYLGTAEEAQQAGAELLEPTEETVDYGDGTTGEAYAFDIPVPSIDQEFDCAIIGTKGTWYDHKVKVTNPEPLEG